MDKPFNLTINTTNSETGLTERNSQTLEVDSDRWKKIILWGQNNTEGWTPSLASHIGDVYVLQSNFRLIYSKGSKGVVISFTDKAGISKQYMNVIEKEDLNFLYE
ncbi:hypothetical protein [Putridiphycobacter roseus]|nr:hypothetical protein [Putridiphycobacter roseus]